MKQSLVIKLLAIAFFCLQLSPNSYAGAISGYKIGKGSLKITKNTADVLEYFFSGGKKGFYAEEQEYGWKPGLIAISIDGKHFSFFRHPYNVTQIDNKHYSGMAISKCKKKSSTECFIFANGYKIIWDNGTNKKKRKLKRKEVLAGKTIAKLVELGFYESTVTKKEKIVKKKENKKVKKSSKDEDIVKKLKELNDLFKSGVLTKEEFEKAKKKLLN